ncbi:MAG: pilus assembly protein CpaB, partial [Actinobacteria bacterium]|nr:pilus assembly protein CpaB [Actinomycetota bacterium]MBU2111175.1 pilus assembly protein CpaB [Actinomycetota bacterium]
GTVLGADDLTTVTLSPDAVPDDVLADPEGSALAGPVARGEPITAVRVVGRELAGEGLAGTGRVAVPVRLPDAGAVGLLSAGDRIDVVATDPQAGTSVTVAAGVPVLALPGADEGAGAGPLGTPGGRLVVLAVEEADVHNLATAGAASFLTYVWSR